MTSPAVQHAASKQRQQRSAFTTPSYAGVDQGVDFTGTGAIPALAPATITDVGMVHIIEGGTVPYVIYRANRGKHKGQYIYVMETFNVRVKVGDTVTAGQSIGYAKGGGYGIEVGFNQGPKGLNPVASLYPNPHSPKPAGYSMLSWLKSRGLKAGQVPSTERAPTLKEMKAAIASDLSGFKNSDGTYGKKHRSLSAIARFTLRKIRPHVIKGELTVDQADALIANYAGTPVTIKTGGGLGGALHIINEGARHIPGVAQVEGAASAVESVGNFLGELANPTTWLRGLYIVGGGWLVLGGLFIVAKELGAVPPVGATVKKAATLANPATLIPK